VEKVTPEGRLTYVQDVGDQPGNVFADVTKNYAAGAFLLAGREMLLQKHKNDTTAPEALVVNKPVVVNQDILLTWQVGVDEESGISGYEIYRDTVPGAAKLLTVTGQVTEYTDSAAQEETIYYYRLKAVNGMGLNSALFSSEVSAATTPDTIRPEVVSITALSDSLVWVKFSEPVEAQTAELAANYAIDNGITVKSAKLMLGEKTVMLSTSPLMRVIEYTLNISGIKDQARAENLIMPMDDKFTLFYYYDDFEAGGKLSWQPKTASNWSIAADNGGNAYSVHPVGERSVDYSLLQDVIADQFELSVKLRAARECPDEFGIIIGYQDSKNFSYIGNIYYTDDVYLLIRVANGEPKILLHSRPLYSDTLYHDLKVSNINGVVAISIDGTEKGRTAVTVPAGKVGFISNLSGSGNTAYFDDFSLTLLSNGYTKASEGATAAVESEMAVEPNPFNPSARISYYIPQKTEVSLILYNLQGKAVKELASGMVSAGRHTVRVDAGGLASGLYICELKSGAMARRLKLMLMK